MTVVNLKKGTGGSVTRGTPGQGLAADCTLTISDDDLVDMAAGKVSGMQVSDLSVLHFIQLKWTAGRRRFRSIIYYPNVMSVCLSN